METIPTSAPQAYEIVPKSSTSPTRTASRIAERAGRSTDALGGVRKRTTIAAITNTAAIVSLPNNRDGSHPACCAAQPVTYVATPNNSIETTASGSPAAGVRVPARMARRSVDANRAGDRDGDAGDLPGAERLAEEDHRQEHRHHGVGRQDRRERSAIGPSSSARYRAANAAAAMNAFTASHDVTTDRPERSARATRARRLMAIAAAICATTTVRKLPIRRPEMVAHRSDSPQPIAATRP